MALSVMSPVELKVVIDRRRQIDSAWNDRELLAAIVNTPQVQGKRVRHSRSKPRRSNRTRLTRGQHIELKHLRMPKGVDWKTVVLSRGQEALLRKTCMRTAQLTERTNKLVMG